MAGEELSQAGESLVEKVKNASPGAKLAIGIGILGILVTIYFATAKARAASNSGGVGGSIPVDGTSGASGGDQFGLFPAGPPSGSTTPTPTPTPTPIPGPVNPPGPPTPKPPPPPAHHGGSGSSSGGSSAGTVAHITHTAHSPAPSANHPAIAWAPHHPTPAAAARAAAHRATRPSKPAAAARGAAHRAINPLRPAPKVPAGMRRADATLNSLR